MVINIKYFVFNDLLIYVSFYSKERKRSELEDNENHYLAEMTKQEELARDLQSMHFENTAL